MTLPFLLLPPLHVRYAPRFAVMVWADALPQGWSKHYSDLGCPYYVNGITKVYRHTAMPTLHVHPLPIFALQLYYYSAHQLRGRMNCMRFFYIRVCSNFNAPLTLFHSHTLLSMSLLGGCVVLCRPRNGTTPACR